MPEEDRLKQISPDNIERNPENPRLIFREDELRILLDSIARVGIRVPLSVYFDDKKDTFVLIDGERRWKCAKKLNLPKVPSIIQPKPNRLENILMMFNIHNVRIAWDLLPMALKLKDIQDILLQEKKKTTPSELATLTGVSLPTIKRAFDLLSLPEKYRNLLMEEAKKPRDQQVIKPDLFIEVYKSLHVIEKHVPEVLVKVPKQEYVESMVNKYLDGVVTNIVSYRDISRIARAEKAGGQKKDAIPTIVRLAKQKDYSIEQAYADTVKLNYEKRDLLAKIEGLVEKLSKYRRGMAFDKETFAALSNLRDQINRLLGNG